MICDIKVFEEKIDIQLFYILYSNIKRKIQTI